MPLEYNERVSIAKSLFAELAVLDGTLSRDLKERLECLLPHDRRKEANQTDEGYTPLGLACLRGNGKTIKFLVKICGANIEQPSKGRGMNSQDKVEQYPPLCWACKTSNFAIIKCLLHLGADINGYSDCGSTPVLHACLANSDDALVKYLIKKGADFRKPNREGKTCLMVSVGSMRLCRYMIKTGVDVNVCDNDEKTALHYAIEGRRLQTVQLLLENGADPFVKTINGDDALQIACIKGFSHIVDYLLERYNYSPERTADAKELLGAKLFFSFDDASNAVLCWKQALQIRIDNNKPKRPEVPNRSAFLHTTEFSTFEELQTIAADIAALRIHSLLVYERLLGIDHDLTLHCMVFVGECYKGTSRSETCLELWKLALQKRTIKHSILHRHTSAIIGTIVDFLYLCLNGGYVEPSFLRFEEIYEIFQFLTSHVIKARRVINIQPSRPMHQKVFEKTVHHLVHLIRIVLSVAKNERDRQLLGTSVQRLVCNDVKCITTGETLLHLSLKRFKKVNRRIPVPVRGVKISPFLDVTKLLLECGALIDVPDGEGIRPLEVLAKNPRIDICLFNYMSLKSRCANVIVKWEIPYRNQIPGLMEDFVRLHDPTAVCR